MNFRQVRKKIKTVSNVKQITKAMQMVASVKMKKSQDQAAEGRPYREILDRVAKRVLSNADVSRNPFIQAHSSHGKNLYVLISSNKGLCGSFNFNLFKLMMSNVDFEKSDFIAVGKKGADFLSRTSSDIIADFSKETPFVDSVSAVFSQIQQLYLSTSYTKVYIIHNSFVSTLSQEATLRQLLPF